MIENASETQSGKQMHNALIAILHLTVTGMDSMLIITNTTEYVYNGI